MTLIPKQEDEQIEQFIKLLYCVCTFFFKNSLQNVSCKICEAFHTFSRTIWTNSVKKIDNKVN